METAYKEIERKMAHTLEMFIRELSGIRTGRASISLLENIKVNYYNTPTPLKQVASLSVPDSQTIMIQPWDKSAMAEIEKSILSSDLGLNPANDGNIIRVPIPPLTEERRKELVKVVKKSVEDCKVAVRNVRREGIDTVKKMEKNKKISEDDLHKAQDHIQKITDNFIKKSDEIFSKKENEILKD